jgi:hypothetical protein
MKFRGPQAHPNRGGAIAGVGEGRGLRGGFVVRREMQARVADEFVFVWAIVRILFGLGHQNGFVR